MGRARTSIAFILLGLMLPLAHAFADQCSYRFYEMVRELAQPNPNSYLNIVPGKNIRYANHYRERLQDAFLVLSPDDNLQTIAKILAQGKNSDRIFQKLLKRVKNPETKISVSEFLPKFAKKQNNLFASCHGPNCWNATLNWYDPKVGIRATSQNEITRAIQNDFVPVTSIENLRFGDTIVVKTEDGHILHTAIHLNRNILWHKAGYEKEWPWTLETFGEAIAVYAEHNGPDIKIEFYRHK